MTETTKNIGEKLSVSSTKTLTLKRGGVEQGVVRQSFSHGRSKAVVVEKVKRRAAGPGEVRQETIAPVAPPKRGITTAKAPPPTPAGITPAPAVSVPPSPKPSGVVLRTLTEEERSARAHALAARSRRSASRAPTAGARSSDKFAGGAPPRSLSDHRVAGRNFVSSTNKKYSIVSQTGVNTSQRPNRPYIELARLLAKPSNAIRATTKRTPGR